MENLLKTPLYEVYKEYGARVVDFAGWALPVQFTGIIEEHQNVRTKAGLFDVSHMGEILVFGLGATDFLEYLLANEITALEKGKIRYAHMCSENGGIVDDILVYRYDDEEYMIVVNASNIDKDLKWIKSHAPDGIKIEDVSGVTAQLAVQGPKALAILKKLTSSDIEGMSYYSFKMGVITAGYKCIFSRTGYTGEDGFEIYCSPNDAAGLWRAVMEAGKEEGVCPAGLGARDTLRFEACMPLYGHELSEGISPLEAGLGKYVKLDKENFIGKKALQAQRENGLKRKLVGLEMVERGIPRNGYAVQASGRKVGIITTGSYCPTIKKNLALALIEAQHTSLGQEVYVEIRGNAVKAKAVKIPFYRRDSLEN